jgi:hypothetical protein
MKNKRLEAGDKILIKSGFYFAYDGYSIKRSIRNIRLPQDEESVISQVISNDKFYLGRHLIVPLTVGTIDLWTGQDQFCFNRVK